MTLSWSDIEPDSFSDFLEAVFGSKPADVPALVRSALFAPPPGGTPDRQLVEIVTERILRAFHQHLADTSGEFERWLSGPNANFIKMIADQPCSPGGRLSRLDVRRVILHLGWESYRYVGICLHAFCGWFQRALPDELSDDEWVFFNHMYLPQPYLGNLPLVLIMERASFVRSAVIDIWSHPNDSTRIGVLHRLFADYADMADHRREVDCRFKQKAADKDSRGKVLQRLGSRDRNVATPTDDHSSFDEIAEQICCPHGKDLTCGCSSLRARLATTNPTKGQPISLTYWCGCGRTNGTIEVTWDEFAQAAKKAAAARE